jgi:hypothetical protein
MKKALVLISLLFIFGLVSFVSASEATYNCLDSDYGVDISIKGFTSGQEWATGQEVGAPSEEEYVPAKYVEVEDYCSEKGLIEYYCSGGFVGSESYGPEDGCLECINGSCIVPDIECKGNDCKRNGVCYSLGDKIGHNEYCSETGNINVNLQEGESCSFDYECSISDVCYEGICLDNLPHIFSRMWNWFSGFFD